MSLVSELSFISVEDSLRSCGKKRLQTSSEKLMNLEKELEEVSEKLAKFKKCRTWSSLDRKGLTRSNSSIFSEKSVKKGKSNPPNDFTMAKIVLSPYMTKPQQQYSPHTIHVHEKLLEIKGTSCKLKNKLEEQKLPVDMNVIRKRFFNEVSKFTSTVKFTAKRRVMPFPLQ